MHASTHDRFGRDTVAAVKAFQRDKGLVIDGIIGKNTLAALNAAASSSSRLPVVKIVQYLKEVDYPQIDTKILERINEALQGETPIRIALVQEDLKWVMPNGIYIYGQNSFTTKLTPNYVNTDMVEAAAKRYPQYYTNGRKAYQRDFVAKAYEDAESLPIATDCSGKEVGLYRKFKLQAAGFDSTAHNLYHTYCRTIKEKNLRPGDLVFKRLSSGRIVHVAMYVGGGYICEAVGTAYGIQITENVRHIVRNDMLGVNEQHTTFNVFGTPRFLA